MANIFKPKRSSTSSSVPTTGDLTDGELAVNSADKIIYLRDGGSIVEVANSTSITNEADNRVLTATGTAGTINGEANLTFDGSALTVTGNTNVTGNLAVDTNTLFVNSTTNRIGIGTDNPAYQVEIENTGANALLVLDRTDGAACFIEGQATRSAFGSVNATPLALAYNSFAVVTIGAGGSIRVNPDGDGYTFPTTDGSANQFLQTDGEGNITFASATVSDISDLTATATELNYLDGVTGITLGTANELLIVGSDGSSIESDGTLNIDPGNNYVGINQASPEVTLHMTGEGAQTAQIRMEQYNDSADAPDVRTRRYRGTIASPAAVQAGDYLYRSNHEYWNGSALIVGGSFAFDNTNNANRTQFAVSVTTDGTSADANTPGKTQFKIDGNDSGAITFNNAYKFPTSDGSANQVLQTDGNGTLSFTDSVTATEHKILDDISSSFNGSTTQFTISSSSTNFLNSEITTAARLLISVGGVVQQPDPTQTNGFYISGGTDLSTDPIKINFVEAPKAGQVFFGVAFGLTTSPTSSFVTSEEAIAYSIVFGV